MTGRHVGLLLLALTASACATTPPAKTVPAPAPRAPSPSGAPTAALPMPPGAALTGNVHVALGIPLDGDPGDDFLLDRKYWVASYNPRRLVPNWVAWSLSAADLGSTDRRNSFSADLGLPSSFTRVGRDDYRGSGYDRGHVCPSADRTASREANASTFLMTNMHPQVAALNQVRWRQLEEAERRFVAGGRRLQIVAGPVYAGTLRTIGPGIAVPEASFKIIVGLDAGQTTVDVTASTMVCSFIMPNHPEVKEKKWYEYLVSVDEVEKQTGYDFMRDVPDDVEKVIEARVPVPEECGAAR